MSDSKLNIVILAAGKGTRMNSALPKVLHALAGKPLLRHVIDCAKQLTPQKIIVVYGHGGDAVPRSLAGEPVICVEQAEQLGTGHAVQQALPHLDADATTLILLGDVPLIRVESCRRLLQQTRGGFARAADGLPLGKVKVASPFDPRARYNLYSCFVILPRHQVRHLEQAEEVWPSLS